MTSIRSARGRCSPGRRVNVVKPKCRIVVSRGFSTTVFTRNEPSSRVSGMLAHSKERYVNDIAAYTATKTGPAA